jgi:citrate lyase beta subunit
MLDPSVVAALDARLAVDDAQRNAAFPGSAPGRQPVHTVYVPAQHFDAGTLASWGTAARAALAEYGPLPEVSTEVAARVHAKLLDEPIEDLRIDFEDGYGLRPDEDEDADVRLAAAIVGAGEASSVPAFVGLRMKSLEGPTRLRGIRTLDLFLETALTAGGLPDGFRVTLPKVTSVAQVSAMVELASALEATYAIAPLAIELQVETPQAVLGPDGSALIARMLHACAGRCVGLHYGTYDYSASLGIAAAYQSMEHPAADYAKAVMQVAAAGTGVAVCDGSTNIVPVGSADEIRSAWALHSRLVRRSLERGYYQGWDLHPAQLPTRFAATFAFFRDALSTSAARLRTYLDATSTGILDEPATAKALAGYLLRGLDSGAVDDAEIADAVGLTPTALGQLAGRPNRD